MPTRILHSTCPWRRAGVAATLSIAVAAATVARAAAPAAVAESGSVDRATAQALVAALTSDLETQALRPRVQAQYDAAKARLQALVDGPGPAVDRVTVYAAARAMLATIDSDGHTMLWSRQQTADWLQATRPQAADDANAVHTVDAPQGRTLVVRPPQTTFVDPPSMLAYEQALIARIDLALAGGAPCGLVIDLRDQVGGNAWPALVVLSALLSPANTARFVDRDGRRTPVVADAFLRDATPGRLPANGLARFAGRPFSVVISPNTASAGEMIAIALRGEAGVRTVGQPTYGATTANRVLELPDEATILLTTDRYAFGEEPPLRGPLRPDIAIPAGDAPQASLAAAAAWACRR